MAKRLPIILIMALVLLFMQILPETAYALTFQPSQGLGAGLDPSIAVDGQNVYVVWRDTKGAVCYPTTCFNDIFFSESTNGGASFSTPINVSHDLASSLFPVIASSGSNIYVAWENSTLYSNPQVYFSRSTNGGSTFSGAAIDLSNDAGYTQNIAVASSGSDVYVVWQDNTPGNYQIFYRLSTDYGANFNPTVNLSNSPAGAPTLSLTSTSIYVAWTYGPGGVKVRRSTDGGNSFGGIYTIAAQAGSRVLFASDSNVYAVWPQQVPRDRNIPPHTDVFFSQSTDGGKTFSTAINLSKGVVNSYRPRISVSGSGNIYVAWLEATSYTYYSLFATSSSNGGAIFDSPLLVSSAVSPYFSQDVLLYGQQYLAVSGSNVYLTWYQENPAGSANYEVYLARGS